MKLKELHESNDDHRIPFQREIVKWTKKLEDAEYTMNRLSNRYSRIVDLLNSKSLFGLLPDKPVITIPARDNLGGWTIFDTPENRQLEKDFYKYVVPRFKAEKIAQIAKNKIRQAYKDMAQADIRNDRLNRK